jgi:Uma2 family endonuclease
LPNKPDEISDEQVYTVVQPDISIICDLKKLDEKGCIGAPDFIIEIISPATAKHDIENKYRLYEKHGVKEYWIVYPESKRVSAFLLDSIGKYQMVGMFADDSEVKVNIFNNVTIDLKEVFKD